MSECAVWVQNHNQGLDHCCLAFQQSVLTAPVHNAFEMNPPSFFFLCVCVHAICWCWWNAIFLDNLAGVRMRKHNEAVPVWVVWFSVEVQTFLRVWKVRAIIMLWCNILWEFVFMSHCNGRLCSGDRCGEVPKHVDDLCAFLLLSVMRWHANILSVGKKCMHTLALLICWHTVCVGKHVETHLTAVLTGANAFHFDVSQTASVQILLWTERSVPQTREQKWCWDNAEIKRTSLSRIVLTREASYDRCWPPQPKIPVLNLFTEGFLSVPSLLIAFISCTWMSDDCWSSVIKLLFPLWASCFCCRVYISCSLERSSVLGSGHRNWYDLRACPEHLVCFPETRPRQEWVWAWLTNAFLQSKVFDGMQS